MRIIIEESGLEYRIASDRPIKTPEQAARAAAVVGSSLAESMVVLCLNTKGGMRASEIVSSGTVDATLVHPREIFRAAILHSASAVVVVHNHPSGDCTPSAEDIRVTRQLVEAGRVVGIQVLDHVIIGVGPGGLCWLSMRENGVVSFTV